MDEDTIEYECTVYQSWKDLYNAQKDPAVKYSTFMGRVNRGWDIEEALTTDPAECGKGGGIQVEYNGETYRSMRSLYLTEKRKMRKVHHRSPAIPYESFTNILREESVEAAIAKMHDFKNAQKVTGAKEKSQALGGADNLVSQRVKKLGWSREKAESTPVITKSLPITCVFKGKRYRSLTECYKRNRVQLPFQMSYPKFVRWMEQRNFVY